MILQKMNAYTGMLFSLQNKIYAVWHSTIHISVETIQIRQILKINSSTAAMFCIMFRFKFLHTYFQFLLHISSSLHVSLTSVLDLQVLYMCTTTHDFTHKPSSPPKIVKSVSNSVHFCTYTTL